MDVPVHRFRNRDMKEELLDLWSLRALDEQASGLEQELSRFPGQRLEVEQRVAADRTRLETLKTRMVEVQKVRREREVEAEAAKEQERKFQSQLPSVRKNEEYTALLHEIEAVRKKRSDIETDVLLRMDEEEQIQQQRPVVERALRESEGEASNRLSEIDREERERRERLASVELQRAELVGRLSPTVRSRYERVRASRAGRAVVPISKGACGGCFRNQPPQILQEARRGDRLLTCDGCGRILIWPPDSH